MIFSAPEAGLNLVTPLINKEEDGIFEKVTLEQPDKPDHVFYIYSVSLTIMIMEVYE